MCHWRSVEIGPGQEASTAWKENSALYSSRFPRPQFARFFAEQLTRADLTGGTATGHVPPPISSEVGGTSGS